SGSGGFERTFRYINAQRQSCPSKTNFEGQKAHEGNIPSCPNAKIRFPGEDRGFRGFKARSALPAGESRSADKDQTPDRGQYAFERSEEVHLCLKDARVIYQEDLRGL